MYKGETVTVLEKGNTWSRVQYGSLTGYSMNGFLQFVEEGGEAPEEPGWDDGGSDIPTKATATVYRRFPVAARKPLFVCKDARQDV